MVDSHFGVPLLKRCSLLRIPFKATEEMIAVESLDGTLKFVQIDSFAARHMTVTRSFWLRPAGMSSAAFFHGLWLGSDADPSTWAFVDISPNPIWLPAKRGHARKMHPLDAPAGFPLRNGSAVGSSGSTWVQDKLQALTEQEKTAS